MPGNKDWVTTKQCDQRPGTGDRKIVFEWQGRTAKIKLLLHPFNSLFSRKTWVSRYKKRKTCLDLNEARDDEVLGRQWHQLDHMQTICMLFQTDNHINTSSLNFYRPDALPDAQRTVLEHRMPNWSYNIRFGRGHDHQPLLIQNWACVTSLISFLFRYHFHSFSSSSALFQYRSNVAN